MRLAADDRALWSVAAVTLAALLARLALLGRRVAHFDEGRVAWWTLEYLRTGEYTYRAVLHGPLLQHVNRHLFASLGPTDAAMRLFPALVTGLLPLSALLFRDRLSDRELVALAMLLAFEPLLLYYGRFSRSDPLVGAFSFVAFALLVRAVDADRAWYVAPALGLLALGLGAKENALLYPVTWLGALALLADHRLLASDDPLGTLRGYGRPAPRRLRRGFPAAIGGLLLALSVLFVLYAPRAPGPAPGIGDLLSDPAVLPVLIDAAFVENARRLSELWLAPNGAFKLEYSYVFVAGSLLKSLLLGSGPIVLLGVGGVLTDRYGGSPRDLVQFGGFWALLSLVGYPAVADVPAPWLGIHVLLPLAVPAAVAVAGLYGVATGSGTRTRARVGSLSPDRLALAALVLIAAATAGTAGYTSYVAPEGPHPLAQHAQPHGDLSPLREEPRDVLVYGAAFVDGDDAAVRHPACVDWFATLPLAWYLERGDATVTCAADAGALPENLPPVVVAPTDAVEGPLADRTDGWSVHRFRFRRSGEPAVALVDPGRGGTDAE